MQDNLLAPSLEQLLPYAIFLDDERSPKDVAWIQYPSDINWHIARTYAEFSQLIDTEGLPHLISFDHDLQDIQGSVEYTGLSCAKWLTELCTVHDLPLPTWVVHSRNGPGSANITSWLTSFEKSRNL